MAGEVAEFAGGIRARAKTLGERCDEAAVGGLRSELFALEAYLRANPKAANARVREALDRALGLAGTAYAFVTELRGFEAQKGRSEAASLFDLGAIGVLAVENVLTADKVTLPRLLMSGLSEALVYLASRQYVAGSREVLHAIYRQHASSMYGELWMLATDHRKRLSPQDVRQMQRGIEEFFGRLDGPDIPVEARIVVLFQFYALLLTLRAAELLEALGG
ncbi:MAG: hypothetical protein HY557_03660 [Euryarchaeota archaeon]|nr:hypothetical protein [Euryarchaeota archaeon]